MNIPSGMVVGVHEQREAEDEVENHHEETGGAALRQHDSPEVTLHCSVVALTCSIEISAAYSLSLVKYLEKKKVCT